MVSLMTLASADCDCLKSNVHDLARFNNLVILAIMEHKENKTRQMKKKALTIVGHDLVMTLKQIMQNYLDNDNCYQ